MNHISDGVSVTKSFDGATIQSKPISNRQSQLNTLALRKHSSKQEIMHHKANSQAPTITHRAKVNNNQVFTPNVKSEVVSN